MENIRTIDLIDLTGRKFRGLTVVKFHEHIVGQTTKWECLCDCGKTIIASRNSVVQGKGHCGCKNHLMKLIDITGQRFGKLIVVKYLGRLDKRKCCWLTLCDCGKEHITNNYNLRNNITRHCGCEGKRKAGYRIDLTNQKFHFLTAIKYITANKREGRLGRWLCRCDCGKEVLVSTTELTSGLRKSCNCKRGYFVKLNQSRGGYEGMRAWVWYSVLAKAKQRNLEVSITEKDAWDQFIKQNHNCAISGVPLKFAEWSTKKSEGTASLDRIDNDKGYLIDNIQWVHKDINYLKQDYTEEEFFNWIDLIYHFQKQKALPTTTDRQSFDYTGYQIT